MSITRGLLLQFGTTALLSLASLAALAGTWVQGLDALPIMISYEGQLEPPAPFTVPADKTTGKTVFRLLEQVIAYRDDHKAVVEFELPPSAPIASASTWAGISTCGGGITAKAPSP